MEHFSDFGLTLLLIFLVLISGFFSMAEIAMMSLNRYRLRHLARKKNHIAKRVLQMVETPERILSLILIGNNFTNILASGCATILAIRLWGEGSVGLAMLALTFIILIFAEIAPKTVAAVYSMRIAFAISWPIHLLLKIFYPMVRILNYFANGLLWLVGIRLKKASLEALDSDELRSILHEAGALMPAAHKNMLLSLLDLENVTVDDIMVPRSEIEGIDLSWSWPEIQRKIMATTTAYIPLYNENIEKMQGMLHLPAVIGLLVNDTCNAEALKNAAQPIYFIPKGTNLYTQLINFRHEQSRCGLVVDEYGDIQGLVTLEDILEEIVGDFTQHLSPPMFYIKPQADGCFIIDGGINLHELNKKQQWHFPTKGPKTLSGLIIEKLEMIPPEHFCLQLGSYRLEILEVRDNLIKRVKVLVG